MGIGRFVISQLQRDQMKRIDLTRRSALGKLGVTTRKY